jgi:DNA-binding SARP family transcriptional activator
MAEAHAGFQRLAAHPAFAMTPPFLALLKYGHQLYALAQQGVSDEVQQIADEVRKLSIPDSNHFHHSYLHFCLGIAHNLLGQPAKGLLHARHAIEIGHKSHSAIARRMPALVEGQSLVNLGRDAEATQHLTRWIKEWRESGYAYFAFAGGLELASVLARTGETARARQAYEEAIACLPPGEEAVPQLLRPPGFVDELRRRLFERPTSAWLSDGQPARPVQITTFGELALCIRGRNIFDRQWRGSRTRTLLKILLALGPEKVPLPVLADALWPDSDADQALSNLKVTLSRLRRIGCAAGEEPLPWLVVRIGCVSLPGSMCYIDFAAFQHALNAALSQGDLDALAQALRIYSADFLAREPPDPWIVERRIDLRRQFVQGVLTFASGCLGVNRLGQAASLLQRALALEPANEALCGLLMDLHLRCGYPSRALEAFDSLKEALAASHGCEPGPALKQRQEQAQAGRSR